MSNNTSMEVKHPIHLFFSPPKPRTGTFRVREDNFVLDCTNPKCAKLQDYQPNDDHFNQSYLSKLFTKLKDSKENKMPRLPRTSDEDKRVKNEKTVSSQDFKKYLSEKLHLVTQTNLGNENAEPRSYLHTASALGRVKRGVVSNKQTAFIEHKFRCFKKRGKVTKDSQ